MPIFEYRCSECGHEFEHLVLKASDPARCPSCHGADVVKLLSLPSLSSEQTRGKSRRDIRARNRAGRRDHDEAEVRKMEAHSEDHDE